MSGRSAAPSETAASNGRARREARHIPASRDLGRQRVAEIQRARMLRAMVDVSAELGVGNVTVAQVVARSCVSRRTFYEIFDDCEECFLAAFDDGIGRVADNALAAYTSASGWRERVRSGLIAVLSLFDSEPRLARLLVVESLGAGPRALGRRTRVIDALISIVDDGRHEVCGDTTPPPLAAEAMVGAVLAVLHGRLTEDRHGRLVDLTNPLMGMIVLPYLGQAASRKELERTSPGAPVVSHDNGDDPLRSIEMRLTYRTVRALSAVASHPGGSNRVIATEAGINDQGQISKLLARLHGLGLIENKGGDIARGEPNAWILTAKGWGVHDAIGMPTKPEAG